MTRAVAWVALVGWLCLGGCTRMAASPPPASAAESAAVAAAAARPAPPVASAPSLASLPDDRLGHSIAALSPPQVIIAADEARADAAGYVAWRQSRPDNIERLTSLTRDLNAAIMAMRAHRVANRYPAADVSAARAALRSLRLFLRNKDD